MVRCRVAGIDAQRLDLIDRLQDALDARPAVDLEEDVTTRLDARQRRIRRVLADRWDDMDTRQDRTVLVRCPANECENCILSEADNARPAIDDSLLRDATEANPLLDLAFDPLEADERPAASRLPPAASRPAAEPKTARNRMHFDARPTIRRASASWAARPWPR